MVGRQSQRPRVGPGRVRHWRSGWTGRTGPIRRLATRGDGLMHIMEGIQAVQKATETDTPFLHATNMEDPLAHIRHLATAICLLCEGMEEPYGSVVQHLGWSIRDNLDRLDKE